jgi:hypothetical protein
VSIAGIFFSRLCDQFPKVLQLAATFDAGDPADQERCIMAAFLMANDHPGPVMLKWLTIGLPSELAEAVLPGLKQLRSMFA